MSLDADKPIPIRVPNDLKAKIDYAASKLGWTTQQTMREAMRLGLEFYERIDYDVPGAVLDATLAKLKGPKTYPFPVNSESLRVAEDPPKKGGKQG